jgi:magnesium and cobalt exporter, CNNM family
MTQWLLVLAGVVLTLGTSVFVAAEFAYITLDRPTVERAVADGDHRSAPVVEALRRLSTQLSASQVGITITTLLVGFLVEPSVARLLTGPLDEAGVPGGLVEPIAVAVALVLATAFSMVVGELVPQFLGLSAPLETAKVVTPFMRVFTAVARPLIVLLNGSANRVLRTVGIEPQEELSAARTPEELASMVLRSAEAGTLDPATAQLVTRSLGFAERTAADVMTPRVRCTSVEREESTSRVIELCRETGHSRFPVVEDDLDHVLGVVHVKKAVAVPYERRGDVPAGALMVDPLVVPESIRLDPLLALLREQGLQLAIVVDEYGGTSGLVTLEDLLEELIGSEIQDEFDSGEAAPVLALGDGAYSVAGGVALDDLLALMHVELDEDDAEHSVTVGGYVQNRLGRIGRVGDVVPLGPEHALRVLETRQRRVLRVLAGPRDRVLLTKPSESPPGRPRPSAP